MICSCDIIPDNSIAEMDADFFIVSKITGSTLTGRPNVVMIVRNIGENTGYNVSCDIQVQRGNTIIGSGFAYFAGGGDIDPGQQAQDEAIFWGVESIADCQLTYNLSWLER